MDVLSLFGGMECGRIAIQDVKINNYYSCEINKHAIKAASFNYPDIIHLGDVQSWREWDLDWSNIDLLIGGSPCQGFSYTGKQLNFNDPRSKLFFVYVDILKHLKSINPSIKFMLENVKMKHEHLDLISNELGVKPLFVDSIHHSPCSRPRYYWSNHPLKKPENNNLYFSEFIDYELEDNYMTDAFNKWFMINGDKMLKKQRIKIVKPNEKGICMTARQFDNWNGNFIKTPSGKLRRLTKKEMCLLIGAPYDYLDCVSQNQAQVLTGNGWDIRVVKSLLKQILQK